MSWIWFTPSPLFFTFDKLFFFITLCSLRQSAMFVNKVVCWMLSVIVRCPTKAIAYYYEISSMVGIFKPVNMIFKRHVSVLFYVYSFSTFLGLE
jgi:hypothetical protein